MTSSSGSRFRLDEHALHASALRAQVLERCRRTLRHDINNAVQSIHSGLELLGKCIASSEVARVSPQECVALLQQQFVTLRETLDRLVSEIAEPAPDPDTFDVSALTDEALQLLRHERAASNAKIHIESGITAYARSGNIRTVVLALLLDAIDHAPRDATLELAVSQQNQEAIVTIKSARSSMTADETSASPLIRLIKSVLASEGVDLRIQRAGGAVNMTLHLPSPADRRSVRPTPRDAVRVLIADRNPDAADSLAMILQLEGMQAQTLYSGEQLQHVLSTFAPDIALIDVDLPGCDVYEVARAVREQDADRPLLAQVSSTDLAKHAAFDAQLLRPVEWSQLQALIAQAREQNR
ncbi:MAG: response regulator [Xanthomonadaceae bacterium]|nr:response regulator [Xanthomonadaceae bacterium]